MVWQKTVNESGIVIERSFVCRESGGAFGVREAAMEEQYFRRLVHSTFLLLAACAMLSASTHIMYWVKTASAVKYYLCTWQKLWLNLAKSIEDSKSYVWVVKPTHICWSECAVGPYNSRTNDTEGKIWCLFPEPGRCCLAYELGHEVMTCHRLLDGKLSMHTWTWQKRCGSMTGATNSWNDPILCRPRSDGCTRLSSLMSVYDTLRQKNSCSICTIIMLKRSTISGNS